MMITKSDFLLFCEAPRHLWARKHGGIEPQMTEFDQHLAEEGNRVEGLAHEYLTTQLLPQQPGAKLLWQQTYKDGAFEARLDGLVKKPGRNHYDLYEVKSSTGVDQQIVCDVTFQAAILDQQIRVDHYYVLHPDKEYHRTGDLDPVSLFIAEDITEQVAAVKPDVLALREEALRVEQLTDAEKVEACLSPKDCPCPDLCHPDLPEFSIFDIPRLTRAKKLALLQEGIREARDIPASFDLNEKQRQVADLARTNAEQIDRDAIHKELQLLQFPLWFLDYETCISAIPLYDGYHPQQQVVFQYSLHRLDQPGGDLMHFGYIAIMTDDPSRSLLEHLSRDLGRSGSVLVWNKTFEMTRNKEMAGLHPEYAVFLEDVNARIYDLGDFINLGYYLHPGFKGSWSIKNVLPVMVPELSYEEMAINKGDQASMAWWNITFGNLDKQEKDRVLGELDKYCELDTFAMVRIFKKLGTL